MIRTILALLLPVALARAASVGGVVGSLVFDSNTHSLRPVFGALGSATLGPPVVSDLDSAAVAPNGRVALAIRGGEVGAITNLNSDVPHWKGTGILASSLRKIVWSADSSTAVSLSTDSLKVSWFRFSPTELAGIDETSIGSLGAPVKALAVSGATSAVVIGVQDIGFYLLESANEPRFLASAITPSAAIFDAAGETLLLADAGMNRILRVSTLSGAFEVNEFLKSSDGIQAPVALFLSEDGKRFISVEQTTVQIFERETGIHLTTLTNEQEAHEIRTISPTSAVMNTNFNAGPIEILDFAAEPRIVYVPVNRE